MSTLSPASAFPPPPFPSNKRGESALGSVQTRSTTTITHIPLSHILAPIPPVYDHSKIERMVDTLTSPFSCGITEDTRDVEMSDTTNNAREAGDTQREITAGQLPPIDILYYRSDETGREFHFAFGGCHRLAAYRRLQHMRQERASAEGSREDGKWGQEGKMVEVGQGEVIVPCKVVKVTKGVLKGYLGGSLGTVLGE